MPMLTERPRPVPPVLRFVVKNGSKMRLSASGSMPGTVVADRCDGEAVLGADVDGDGAAVRHRLASVRDQVQEDLLELVRARVHQRAGILVGVDELDALVRVRPPHEVDGRANDVVERHLVPLLRVLAREVEQRAHDLLDLEPGLLDQLEALLRLRAGLRLLEQELGQAEDREQRVVDLVRDTRRELADRGQLAALHELLLHAALLGGVADQRQQERGLAVGAGDRARRDLDRTRPAVRQPEDLLGRSDPTSARELCARLRPWVRRTQLRPTSSASRPTSAQNAAFTFTSAPEAGSIDGDRDGERVEERVQRVLVQLVRAGARP